MLKIEVGDVVVSIAGRDIGNLYIVKAVDENYLHLVDGKGKTNLKPKLKKVKHIRPTGQKCEALKNKWLSQARVLDAEIRKTISNLT